MILNLHKDCSRDRTVLTPGLSSLGLQCLAILQAQHRIWQMFRRDFHTNPLAIRPDLDWLLEVEDIPFKGIYPIMLNCPSPQ